LSILTDIVSAVGSIIGGIAAAVGLFYVAFQFKKSVKEGYYNTLTDVASKIESLESDPKLNTDRRTIAMKYLNLFERIASFANTGFIDKEIARYFEDNFKRALGLLEMKEYADYMKSFKNLKDWRRTKGLEPSPPLLPYPNIHIKGKGFSNETDAYSSSYFDPNPYRARVGDFVTWINDTTTLHTVTSGTGPNDQNAGKEFDSPQSGVLALTLEGRMFSHEFSTAGSFGYFCRIHPVEAGKVVVGNDPKDNASKTNSHHAKVRKKINSSRYFYNELAWFFT
jgi:plastocyanin